MEKLIYSGDQDELVKQAGRIAVFYESLDGIKAADVSDFSNRLMREFSPDDRHYASHLITMGDGENYGFNKNGDFWTRDGLERRHGTFETHGHYFLEHENHDPSLKLGDIKAARFNAEMGRGEVIIHADKRKDEEGYQAAKAGKVLTYSMSARVPGDFCSCCDHFAKRSSDYCSHAKHNMTRWMPEFKKFAYVVNKEPTFFDISKVANRADRIALRLRYKFSDDELQKAASTAPFLFSDMQAKLAGVLLSDEPPVVGCVNAEYRAWMTKLAAAEGYAWQARHNLDNVAKDAKYQFLKHAAVYAFDSSAITDTQIAALRTLEPDVMIRKCVKRAAILPPVALYCYINGGTIKEAKANRIFRAAESQMPQLFRSALVKQADEQLERLLAPACEAKSELASDDPIEKVMDQVGEDYSIDKPTVKQRMLSIRLSCPEEQEQPACACSPEEAKQASVFAQAYALYKVASVAALASERGHSFIDDATLLMLACQSTVKTESI